MTQPPLRAASITRRLRAAGIDCHSHLHAPGIVRIWLIAEDADLPAAKRAARAVLLQAGYDAADAYGYTGALLAASLSEPAEEAPEEEQLEQPAEQAPLTGQLRHDPTCPMADGLGTRCTCTPRYWTAAEQLAEEQPAETYGTTPGQTWPPQASRYAPRAEEDATIPYHAQLLAMTDADLYAWHEEIARRLMALRSAPKGTRGGKLLRLTRETIQQERARRQAARYAPCSAGRRCGYYGACRCAALS